MNDDLLSSLVYLLAAGPTSPHDQLNVSIYENGFATSSALTTPVLSGSGLSKAYVYPKLFVAIRSVLVHAAIRWPAMIAAHQIVDSLQEALFIIGECQAVFCRSEVALLVSGDSAQDIISRCHLHNNSIPWGTLAAIDAQTKPMAQFATPPVDPLEQYLNLEALQMRDTSPYELMVQPNDLVNEYDGPLFDDWNSFTYPTSCESGPNTGETHHYLHDYTYCPSTSLPPGVYSVEYSALDIISHEISVTLGETSVAPFFEYSTTEHHEDASDSPSPSSTRSSPFPETPALDSFHSELPRIASPMSTVVREEQNTDKVTQIVLPTYPTSPASVAALSPLSERGSPPSSRCSSTTPSSHSSEYDPTPSTSNEEIHLPVKVAGKKTRRSRTGAIRKKKAKSKEKHFCYYCKEPFTRDHDAERHQRTCTFNPNRSQKEQCKVCTKPLPVRLDARRRHWGTLECSDAARKLGLTRVDEESYEHL